MSVYLRLEPRDPVVARDGRPFGVNQGRRMRPVSWLYPSLAAGALRTALGKEFPGGFADCLDPLKAIEIAGPLPVSGQELFLPACEDLLQDAAGVCHARRPLPLAASMGTDLPSPTLQPVMLNQQAGEASKLMLGSAWWSVEKMAEWLACRDQPPSGFFSDATRFRQAPAIDERTHVAIDPRSLSAFEGLLFSTAGLVLEHLLDADGYAHRTTLTLRLRGSDPFSATLAAAGWHPAGGERRLLYWNDQAADAPSLWECPDSIKNALKSARRVRMVLVTPAIFEHGWRPGWLKGSPTDGWEGCPPGTHVKLRLVGVCNQRWRAISGFSLERSEGNQPGPKPVRRLTPAGAVYFFEAGEDAADLAGRWLEPVSDQPEDRRDGFGLSVWGVW